MSMLIIGVNPPKSCYACSWYNKVQCPVSDGRYYYRAQRHPSCPLIELPPHGRLIDADVMEVVRCKDCKYAEYIDDVQTLWCTECGQGRTVAPNDFCSYAERREVTT